MACVINIIWEYYHLCRLETVNVYKPCLPFPKRNVSSCYKNRLHYDTSSSSQRTLFR